MSYFMVKVKCRIQLSWSVRADICFREAPVMFLLWGKTIIDNWSCLIKVGWIVVSSKDSGRNWRVIQRNPGWNELKGTANKQLLFLMIYESPNRSSIGCQKCSTIGFLKSYSNRPYSRYPPSLHTLKDWWDKGNVTWFLEGGAHK